MEKRQRTLMVGVVVALAAATLRFSGWHTGAVIGGEDRAGGCGAPLSSRTQVEEAPASPTVRPVLPVAPVTPAEREALGRYGALHAVGRLPPVVRATAALAIDRILARPESGGVDPEQIHFSSVEPVNGGGTIVRVRQMVGRVPVFGSDVQLVLDRNQQLTRLSGNLRPTLKVDTVPSLTQSDAVSRAIASVSCADCNPASCRSWLMVLPQNGQDHLTWRIWPRVGKGGEEKQPMVFLDAHTGEVLWTCAHGDDPACFDEKR